MKVPFVNLKVQYATIKTEIDNAVQNVFSSGQYIKGEYVTEFEKTFATKLGAAHCIGVGNGTDALFIALKSLNIQPGDEVLTPALSWISTAETISLTGAKPVFVDVDPDYFHINLKEAQRLITTKTKAIIAVHLYGQTLALQALKNFCVANNLLLIEDCAQAHFSSYQSVVAGTIGDVAAFSFYPTKNLGAYGDAGCVVTNDAAIALTARRFSNHGGLHKNEHLMEGINSRMDELQAAILSVKLAYIDKWNEQRIQHAATYRKELAAVASVKLPALRPHAYHTYHQFVVRTQDRNELKNFLLEKGVETEIHYPEALPYEPAYVFMNRAVADFPVAHELTNEILSLPIYPELKTEQIEYVCSAIQSFYSTR
jgi:dTDP-4-amino-4,6-dideoxygalactose transaminase